MKVQSSLRRATTGDPGALKQVARDLGHELPRRRVDVLTEFRAGLAEIADREEHGWSSGYRAALADLAAAYEAAIEPELDLDEAERIVRSRKGWPRLIATIARRPSRPTELAREIAMDVAAVSRALGELKQAGIVESAAHVAGEDARARPVRLTLLGERLVRRLEPETPPREAEAILKAAIALFAHLVTERRIRRPYLENLARAHFGNVPVNPRHVVALLTRLAVERALVSEIDGVYVAAESTASDRIGWELELALRERRPPRILVELAARLPSPEQTTLFVRCGKLRDAWNLVLERHAPKLADARTIDWPDLKIGAIPMPSRGPLALVYDSLTLLENDRLEAPPQMRALIDRADHRFVYASPTGSIPDGFEAIAVES